MRGMRDNPFTTEPIVDRAGIEPALRFNPQMLACTSLVLHPLHLHCSSWLSYLSMNPTLNYRSKVLWVGDHYFVGVPIVTDLFLLLLQQEHGLEEFLRTTKFPLSFFVSVVLPLPMIWIVGSMTSPEMLQGLLSTYDTGLAIVELERIELSFDACKATVLAVVLQPQDLWEFSSTTQLLVTSIAPTGILAPTYILPSQQHQQFNLLIVFYHLLLKKCSGKGN